MRKILSVLTALVVLFAAVAMTGCTPSKKYQQKVLDYLTGEYPGKTFELLSYTQNKETSGRYEVKARCNEDGTNFDIYVYSMIFLTDGYSVSRANQKMTVCFRDIIVGTEAFGYVEGIRWLRPFNEENTDYSFRHVENVDELTLDDVKTIDSVKLSEVADIKQLALEITATIGAFDLAGVVLDEMYFDFDLGGRTFRLKTDTVSVRKAKDGELAAYISEEVENTVEVTSVWIEADNVIKIEFVK